MEIIRKNIEKLVDKLFLPKYDFVLSVEVNEVDKKGLPSYNDDVFFITTVIHFNKDFFEYTEAKGEYTHKNHNNIKYMDAILSELLNLVSYVITSDQVYITSNCFYGVDKYRGSYSLYKKNNLMSQSDINKVINEIKYKIDFLNL